MNTFVKHKPSDALTFINLKTFINEYFEKVDYTIVVENENYITSVKEQSRNTGIYMRDRILDCNLRVVDTYLPEYLLFITQNISSSQPLKKVMQVGLPNIKKEYQHLFLKRKIFHLLEAIICSNLSNEVWHNRWNRDLCYVIKRNDELEYYTVYDYHRLIDNLFNWLIIKFTTTSAANVNTYRIRMKLEI